LESMSGKERAGWEAALTRIPMIDPSEVAEAILEIVRNDEMAG
jgi:hypothetical protein